MTNTARLPVFSRTMLTGCGGSGGVVLSPAVSSLQAEAHRALRELTAAARSFRIMADYLERHPEALIRGKGNVRP